MIDPFFCGGASLCHCATTVAAKRKECFFSSASPQHSIREDRVSRWQVQQRVRQLYSSFLSSLSSCRMVRSLWGRNKLPSAGSRDAGVGDPLGKAEVGIYRPFPRVLDFVCDAPAVSRVVAGRMEVECEEGATPTRDRKETHRQQSLGKGPNM